MSIYDLEKELKSFVSQWSIAIDVQRDCFIVIDEENDVQHYSSNLDGIKTWIDSMVLTGEAVPLKGCVHYINEKMRQAETGRFVNVTA